MSFQPEQRVRHRVDGEHGTVISEQRYGGKVRYREWLPFLGLPDASYWNVELKDD